MLSTHIVFLESRDFMYQLTRATNQELPAIEAFYQKMVPLINDQTTSWILGVYPSFDVARQAVLEGEFFLLKKDEDILGTVILNHTAHEYYHRLTWKTDTQINQHLIVHTLITDQTKPRQGIGSQMIEHIKQYSRKLNVASIRLDTALTNLPARRLYEKSGFHYIGQTDLPKFDQTGSDECVFYEYIVSYSPFS